VVRFGSGGDGVLRPDLYEWRWREGDLRRLTRGAAIRQADPEPGGNTAVGTRCLGGACDLVRVDLASGEVTLLAAGEPDGIAYASARSAPDGRIVASVRLEDRWRIGLFDREGGFLRTIDPDDGAARFSASFLPGSDAVVAVSDRSGVLDLERVDLTTGEVRPITRSTGASVMPAPDPATGGIFFLALTTHGYDLRRVHPDSARVSTAAALDPDLAPVAPVPPVVVPEFASIPAASVPYGLGPREHLVLPLGHWAPEGWSAGAMVHGSDPVGRLGWVVGAMSGGESAWRGASAAATWRGWRPELRGAAFWARHRPSEQTLGGIAPPVELDHEVAGGALALELRRDFVSRDWAVRLGGSAAQLDRPEMEDATRALAYAEAEASWLQARGRWRFVETVELHGAAGETGDDGWRRGILAARAAVRRKGSAFAVEALYGATDGGPGGFETFTFGGVRSPLVPPELLSQRVELPAVPVGYASGNRAASIQLAWVAGGVTTYYRWVSAGESIDRWKRVTGIEIDSDAPAIPYLGLPGMRLIIGYGRSLDEPFEDEDRLYLAARYRP
jgi:hypothetical protein